MKNFFAPQRLVLWLLLAGWTSGQALAQVPQNFNYQAVARDAEGFPVESKPIAVELTVLRGPQAQEVTWKETHLTTTNAFGLFNLVVGQGFRVEGLAERFEDIDWADGEYHLRARADFGASATLNGMIDMGTVRFQSVPYALVADSALNARPQTLEEILGISLSGLQPEDVLRWNGTSWTVGNFFLEKDGSTDLTGDWVVHDDNITLVDGTLTAYSLQAEDITLNRGQARVNNFDPNFWMGEPSPQNQNVPTQLAVWTYVNHKVDSVASVNWQRIGSRVFNVNDLVGIGTNNPATKFHAQVGANGFLVTGSHNGFNGPDVAGAGTRLMFYPGKSAFRAGTVESSQWDNANVGSYSAALGRNTTASGEGSFAAGSGNVAQGIGSASFGQDNLLQGAAKNAFAVGELNSIASERGLAFGRQNSITGVGSATIGSNNTISGVFALAVGSQITLNGADFANAFGQSNSSNGKYSFLAGQNNVGNADYTVAIGSSNNATKYGAFALGLSNIAEGNHAFALGSNLRATSLNEVVLGRFNTYTTPAANGDVNWNTNDRLLSLGNGTAESQRSDAIVVWKDGKVGIGTSNRSDFGAGALLFVDGSIQANNVALSSDARFKTDIQTLEDANATLARLRGVRYHWNQAAFPDRQFETGLQFGLVAQEVEAVLPELVRTDGQGFKSVNYTALVPFLLEALKEQQAEIDRLEAQNAQAAQGQDALRAELDALRARMDRVEAAASGR